MHVLGYYQPYLVKMGEGSTNQTELKPAVIADIYIPLPPLDEQKKIAEKIEMAVVFLSQL